MVLKELPHKEFARAMYSTSELLYRNSPCSTLSGSALSHIKPGTTARADRTAVECFLLVWQFLPRK